MNYIKKKVKVWNRKRRRRRRRRRDEEGGGEEVKGYRL